MRGLRLRCAAALVVGASAGYLAAGEPVPRVDLAASKFAFSTNEVRVKKGRPVTLVLTTTDFVHGFSVPDFGVRRDMVPGRTVEVTLTPDRAGRFVFLCDNFCGEGHDAMTGVLVVME